MAFIKGASKNSLSLYRYAQLSKLRDPLIELNRVIDWALFRSTLSTIAEKPRIARRDENG
jgi:hypothetical protein